MNIKLNPAQPKARAENEEIKVADAIPGLTTEQDTIVSPQGDTQAPPEGGDQGEPPVAPETPPVVAPESTSDLTLIAKERVPSDWVIIPIADKVEAVNNNTGKRFIGTMQEFNALMRG